MDSQNRFASRTTYTLLRLEYLLGLLVCVALALHHIEAIEWVHFVVLFVVIDVVGYIPGAIAYRTSEDRRIAPVFFTLYNVTHSFLCAGLVALSWSYVFGPEWALLALPIHLCGDRALFGNMLKSTRMSFEPEPHPAVQALDSALSTECAGVPARSRRPQ